ncbi:universal stress protein [Lentzea sp. NBC_00516]|nr:universal stress protein [Lentzea sp. NBC_00516]
MGNAPIVVGVNGTPASDEALRWAMDEATLRNCRLHVGHAWISEPLVDWNETSARNELSLSETLVDAAVRAALIGRVQPPEIEPRSLRGDAAEVLEEASKDAALLVVASPTGHRLRQVVLGSTSMHCVRHSSVPVVVIPVNEHSASNET